MEPARRGDRIEASADPLARPSPPPEMGGQAIKALPVKLLESDSAEDAAVCVLSAGLDQFEANLPLFRKEQSPESVHQMRVALRRLRAALGLFRPAAAGPAPDAARGAAKEIGSALGRARNWDVFQDLLIKGPGPALGDDPAYYALLDAVARRRAKAYRAAAEALDGPYADELLVTFRKAIAERAWTVASKLTEEGSAKDFAREALTRLRKRVLKKSKGLAKLSPQDRHRARIALKKARYGAEFFESLFGGEKAAADFIAALAMTQDGLGVYNDLAMANALFDEIDAEAGPSLRASGFVRGWFSHAAQAGAAQARKSEKRLRKLEPFWD
jgi:CHAD domain-containing protein